MVVGREAYFVDILWFHDMVLISKLFFFPGSLIDLLFC